MERSGHHRVDRSEFEGNAPGVAAALRAIGKAVEESGIDLSLIELLKIRASQINGCAFCLQFHLNAARKLGVAPTKIDLVATWREAVIFSRQEVAALAWTDALTLMAHGPIPERVYADLESEFSAKEIVFLTVAIGLINAWNRIAGGLRFTPPIPAGRFPMEGRG
ncbi:carboxymuconolactone decarboxylase family protein [Acidithiobacillus caldus]|jgi:AhpD family alkylhydroperoxidase|uniref:YnjA n=1 Tax=Acidithiobacillus caldus (strain SM-1) TaxID=990288 RepID=F9ZP54_ACICS|nr:carboxymuconolactone decarboxylase family protein [Acidithiobacillus caldus]AEK58455.1 YnjA [Acidithiobacillus caldus SM-1]AUW33041.1 carboxymuconolactone decarboxylase family protein [Acidithiobacillus caldus]QER45392.1 alkylhydroperoxidase like protein, AhpD family [Acidithiobacillus caldus]